MSRKNIITRVCAGWALGRREDRSARGDARAMRTNKYNLIAD